MDAERNSTTLEVNWNQQFMSDVVCIGTIVTIIILFACLLHTLDKIYEENAEHIELDRPSPLLKEQHIKAPNNTPVQSSNI